MGVLPGAQAGGFPAEPPCYATVDEVQALMCETGVAHTTFLNFTWSGRYYAHGQYTLPDDPRRRAEADRERRARIVQRVHDNNEWAVSVVREHRNIAHLGHDPRFGEGADREVVELARAYEGVHTDVSLRFPEVAEGHIPPEAMVAHLRRIGTDRVFYGSNFPFVELLHPDSPRWTSSRPCRSPSASRSPARTSSG